MTNFGILKSKIENVLLESYKKGTFKSEIKNFKKYVLENKNVSKLYYLYDELSSNKGMDKDIVNDYINECIIIYENITNKLTKKDVQNIQNWVGEVKSNNLYESVDNLFSTNVLKIDSKIKSRKQISETLQKKKEVIKETHNIPLSSIISIANKTVSNYITSLNENDKKELLSVLNEDESKLKEEYDQLKESSIEKLKSMSLEESNSEINKIMVETIDKVSSEEFDRLNYYKLKKLYENL
jgi:hypothetical protein